MVIYGLISVDLDGDGCDRITHGDNLIKFDVEEPTTSSGRVSSDLVVRMDNLSKFINSDGVSCKLDDFVVYDDSIKFCTQGNFVVSSAWIQFTVVEFVPRFRGKCGVICLKCSIWRIFRSLWKS